MSQLIVNQKNELRVVECYNCLSTFTVPVNAGCTICPTCGQKFCSA